jgi:hypothetical protein
VTDGTRTWDECLGEVPGSDSWVGPDGEQRGRKRGGRNLSSAEMREMGFTRLPSAPKVKFVHHATRVRAQVEPYLQLAL